MEYPRVTEILKYFTSYEKVDPGVLKRAAERGSSVHALCAGIAKGAWIPDGMIADEFKGYVDSFKKWAASQVSSFDIVEKRYQDETLGFTGQLDFVVTGSDGQSYLVDLKTSSSPQKTYPLQMAAYKHLLAKHNVQVKAAMLVYLSKTGEFPEIDRHDDLDEETWVFMSALDCWKYFNKRKLNGTSKRNTRKRANKEPEPVSAHPGSDE